VSDHTARAIRALTRAQALLGDLDRTMQQADLNRVAAGARKEVSDALSALKDGAGGDSEGKARRDASGTSRKAARSVKPRSGTQRAAILHALADTGGTGATDYQLGVSTKIRPSSLRPRRGELVDGGYVAPRVTEEGRAVTRQHNGEDWTVWRLTDAGTAIERTLRERG
jgi:hypothetical protein